MLVQWEDRLKVQSDISHKEHLRWALAYLKQSHNMRTIWAVQVQSISKSVQNVVHSSNSKLMKVQS